MIGVDVPSLFRFHSYFVTVKPLGVTIVVYSLPSILTSNDLLSLTNNRGVLTPPLLLLRSTPAMVYVDFGKNSVKIEV